jgi:hypothetical protein
MARDREQISTGDSDALDRVQEQADRRAAEAEELGQGDVTGPGGKTSTGGSEEADPPGGFPGNSVIDIGPGPQGTADPEQRRPVLPPGEDGEPAAGQAEAEPDVPAAHPDPEDDGHGAAPQEVPAVTSPVADSEQPGEQARGGDAAPAAPAGEQPAKPAGEQSNPA